MNLPNINDNGGAKKGRSTWPLQSFCVRSQTRSHTARLNCPHSLWAGGDYYQTIILSVAQILPNPILQIWKTILVSSRFLDCLVSRSNVTNMISTQAKPAGKGLSTGTLSLKFMQNAHRAKQLAQIELEQAEVKDEAEWEVSKAVREAWGPASESGSPA